MSRSLLSENVETSFPHSKRFQSSVVTEAWHAIGRPLPICNPQLPPFTLGLASLQHDKNHKPCGNSPWRVAPNMQFSPGMQKSGYVGIDVGGTKTLFASSITDSKPWKKSRSRPKGLSERLSQNLQIVTAKLKNHAVTTGAAKLAVDSR